MCATVGFTVKLQSFKSHERQTAIQQLKDSPPNRSVSRIPELAQLKLGWIHHWVTMSIHSGFKQSPTSTLAAQEVGPTTICGKTASSALLATVSQSQVLAHTRFGWGVHNPVSQSQRRKWGGISRRGQLKRPVPSWKLFVWGHWDARTLALAVRVSEWVPARWHLRHLNDCHLDHHMRMRVTTLAAMPLPHCERLTAPLCLLPRCLILASKQ